MRWEKQAASKAAPVGASANDMAAVQIWRERALDRIFRGVLLFGALALASAITDILLTPPEEQPFDPMGRILLYSAAYGFIALAYFVRQFGFTFRAHVPTLLIYGVGLFDFYVFGMRGNALFLIVPIMFYTLFFGTRAGAGAMVFTLLLLYIGVGTALSTGGTGFPFQQTECLDNLLLPVTWFSEGIIFLFLASVVVMPTGFLMHSLSQSIRETSASSRRTAEALHQSQMQAQELAEKSTRLEQVERDLRILVEELETPVVELAEGLLLAPLVGTIDTHRADNITRRLLHEAHDRRTRTIIVDITGVAAVDTRVAHALLSMAQALRLLGCSVVLTGVSAAVATTITTLGIDLGGLETASSPREVLARYQAHTPGRRSPPGTRR